MFGRPQGLGEPDMGTRHTEKGKPAAVAAGLARHDGDRTVSLSCVRLDPLVRRSPRMALVQHRFGVGCAAGRTLTIAKGANVPLGPGRIVLLVGPSGSGKSSALASIASGVPRHAIGDGGLEDVQLAAFPPDCGIIDEIAPDADFAEAAGILTACGLGEAGTWLRPYAALSEGEKFRARLARTISLHAGRQPATLLCDEFCTGLHRRVAKAIAHNLRKLVTRRGLCLVVACSTDDLTRDLDPDTVATFHHDGSCSVLTRRPRVPAVLSLARKLHIEPGLKRDYEEFASMHYRSTDELGFVDQVFVLRESPGGDALGIVVYAHAALELSLRNQASNGWFSRNPQRVNEHLRILRRLVIHPDVRGCGLGHFLVRQTLPRSGTEYVECLAAMGEFNPVFERAGMIRIGQYDAPAGQQNSLDALRAMDVDPQASDFAIAVARRPAVRSVVAKAVARWYAATTGGGNKRVARQSPEVLARAFRGLIGVRPVYYLWRRTPLDTNEKQYLSKRTQSEAGETHIEHRESSPRGDAGSC